MLGAPHPPNVDAVEQHRELRRVHLDRPTIFGDARCPEPTALQPLVIENEPAPIPKQEWGGGLDQFRMYNSALSAAEVQSLYTGKM